jgi:hypothetical protein
VVASEAAPVDVCLYCALTVDVDDDELQALIAADAPAAVWPVQQASTSVIA